ncbi:MAG: hypothetical protein RR598_11645 [Anaerorhabdus sp.]
MTKKELSKQYFRASLSVNSDEELIYNNFYIYVIGIIELTTFIALQGEFNTFSCILLIILSITLCKLGYRLGSSRRK